MKYIFKLSAVTLAFCLLLSGARASAQSAGRGPGSADFNHSTPTNPYSSEKKAPSFFHRPSKATPAEQFNFARAMEQRGKLKSAIRAYDDIVHEWHTSPQAVQAQYREAVLLLKRKKYTKSFKEFQYLIDHFAGLFNYDKVLDYQTRIARQVMEERWGDVLFLPGFKSPEKALPLFEQILKNAPNWNRAAAVRLKMGKTYQQLHQYKDAIKSYDTVQQHNPNSKEAEPALFHKAYCRYILAKKTPRDEKRCRQALSALTSFITRYPMSKNRQQAEKYQREMKEHLVEMYYQRAYFYDRAKKYRAAIIAYNNFLKKFPGSDKATVVFARIKELKALTGITADNDSDRTAVHSGRSVSIE